MLVAMWVFVATPLEAQEVINDMKITNTNVPFQTYEQIGNGPFVQLGDSDEISRNKAEV